MDRDIKQYSDLVAVIIPKDDLHNPCLFYSEFPRLDDMMGLVEFYQSPESAGDSIVNDWEILFTRGCYVIYPN